jgi:hypothetical protein
MNLEIFNEPYDTSLFLVLVNILQSAPLLEELELHVSDSTVQIRIISYVSVV